MKSPIDCVPFAEARRHTDAFLLRRKIACRNCLISMKDIYVFVQQCDGLAGS
jgi:hypothetical protein